VKIDETQQVEAGSCDLPQESDVQEQSVVESRRRFARAGLAASGVLLTLTSRSVLGATTPSGFVSGNVSQHGAKTSSLGSSITDLQSANGSWNGADPSKCFCDVFGVADTSNFGCYINYIKPTSPTGKCTYKLGSKTNDFVKYTLLDVLSQKHVGYYRITSGQTGKSEIDKNKNNTCYIPVNDSTKCNTATKDYRPLTHDSYAINDLAQHCVAALINSRAGKTPYLPESTIKEMFNKCSHGKTFNPTTGVDWTAADCIAYLKTTWDD
jgi:hypothetical protein